MSTLDQGWMQVYCENAEEAYNMTLFSLRLAESVYLPIMVCIDGFYTSHNMEIVNVYDDKTVKEFIGNFKPNYSLLDIKKPITVGALSLTDSYFEIRKEMYDAFFKVKENYLKISKEYKETFGKNIKFYEDYFASNSETVLVVLSSTGEASKDVIDKLRKEGKDVGLLRPILFRPFLYEEYSKALTKAKKIIVLERTESPGSFPPLYKEICLTVRDNKNWPEIFSFVFGLGGRDIYQKDIEELLVSVMSGKKIKSRYIGIKG